MKGATEYYKLFGKSQQIGRLYLQLSTHARGECFEIFLLPDGMEVNGDRVGIHKNTVEVYGMVSGQRGWTEVYGWKYKGKWQDDFYHAVEKREEEVLKLKELQSRDRKVSLSNEKKRINNLLANY